MSNNPYSRSYGPERKTRWEKIWLYFPLYLDGRWYWWRWAERRVVVDRWLEETMVYFEWRVV